MMMGTAIGRMGCGQRVEISIQGGEEDVGKLGSPTL